MNPIPPCTDAPSAPHHEADGRDFQILKDDGLRALLMGEMPYAIRCFSAALKIKDDAEVRSRLAETCLASGRPADALPHLEQLAQADAAHPEPAVAAARAALRCGQPDRAARWVEQACRLAPERPDVRCLEAALLHAQGNDLMAVAKATQALATDDGLTEAARCAPAFCSAWARPPRRWLTPPA